jgi:transcriptional regulator with XRE-family HTH domain
MKELREKAGLTRAQLSEQTGISFRTIEAYEQGRKDINGAKLKTLLKLCQALGCSLSGLLTDEETKELLKQAKV